MHVWITLIYQLARRALGNASLWAWVEERVQSAATLSLTGEQKRSYIERQLAEMPPASRAMLDGVATWVLNLAIEAMVAKIKTKSG